MSTTRRTAEEQRRRAATDRIGVVLGALGEPASWGAGAGSTLERPMSELNPISVSA
jgi:hypothetical protein